MSNSSPPSNQIRWWELEIPVPEALIEDVAALLVEGGANGVQIGESTLIAFYEDSQREGEILESSASALSLLQGPPPQSVLRRREGAEWSERWKEYYHPLQIGRRIWIVPIWEKANFRPAPGALTVLLDPGMAFGTGQHASTVLCLRLLEDALEKNSAQKTLELLDVGCGSGVLSIAALKMCPGRAMAIDVDELAVRATTENAALNDLARSLKAVQTPLEQLEDDYSLIVANIIAPILINLAPAMVSRCNRPGDLILSGILAEQVEELSQSYQDAARAKNRQLKLIRKLREQDWVALWYRCLDPDFA